MGRAADFGLILLRLVDRRVMGYRLIALDIDGTIRSNEYPISPRTRQTIAAVRRMGAAVTLATGRMFGSARRSSAELEILTPIASYQGAHIADPATGTVLWHRPLTPHMARMALDALAPSRMEVMAYHADEVYVRGLTPRVEAYGERNDITIHVVGDLKEVAAKGLTRLVVVGDEGPIQRLEAELKAGFDSALYVTRSLPHFCEILHPQGGKDKALAWLCRYLGVRRDETVAFGNGYNDVGMLRWVVSGHRYRRLRARGVGGGR